MNSLRKLLNFDRRLIYVVMLVLVSIPLINPIGIPLGINQGTRNVFNEIDSLQAGDRVLFSINYDPTSAPDIHPQAVIVLEHLMQKNVKVALVTFAASGPNLCEQLIAPYLEQGKVYGDDLINLGFIAGAETAIRNVGLDVIGTAKVDYRGNDLHTVPILQGVVDARDFDLVYVFHGYNPGVQEWVRQVQGPLGIRMLAGVVMVSVPEIMPFFTSGQIAGLTQGLRGAAEYELLLDKPGSAVAKMDAQSLGHLVIIFFVALGNVAYFIDKKKVKK